MSTQRERMLLDCMRTFPLETLTEAERQEAECHCKRAGSVFMTGEEMEAWERQRWDGHSWIA